MKSYAARAWSAGSAVAVATCPVAICPVAICPVAICLDAISNSGIVSVATGAATAGAVFFLAALRLVSAFTGGANHSPPIEMFVFLDSMTNSFSKAEVRGQKPEVRGQEEKMFRADFRPLTSDL
jgi:predicted transporter